MSTFVLVHGSFHGAWVWEQVVPLVEARGHRAIAIDLPGHGRDDRPLATQTLASYVDAVRTAAAGPIVLVGHSMGGIVITQAAEALADRVSALIYVCAFLPANGQSLLDLGASDSESLLVRNLVIDEDAGLHWIHEDAVTAAFYHDCPPDIAAAARRRIVREPLAPVATPVAITPERYGAIPRAYIECTEDRALSIAVQRRMVSASPCARLASLPSSHTPQLAMPERLAAHIQTFAKELT
ncbi:MAG: alpha/beta hydrolase [Deltaproteobacteria bacterium]|nr:alpha/beta hydrolase [Deltaproteobacteria bacterium]